MWCRLADASCWVRYCQQRGHAGPSVAALGADPASPLWRVRRSGAASVSARGAAAPRAGAAELHRQCCARWQSERCGAACRLVSLAHRGWPVVSGPWWYSRLRQSYITPHCMKYPPASRKLLCVRLPLRALRVYAAGCYAKLPALERARQPSALPGQFLPYAPPPVALAAGGRCGLCQALRAVALFSGLRPCVLCVPRPPLGLACCAASPARSARPPPRGSLQCRAEGRVQGGGKQALRAC